jgi:hypothetical protein
MNHQHFLNFLIVPLSAVTRPSLASSKKAIKGTDRNKTYSVERLGKVKPAFSGIFTLRMVSHHRKSMGKKHAKTANPDIFWPGP